MISFIVFTIRAEQNKLQLYIAQYVSHYHLLFCNTLYIYIRYVEEWHRWDSVGRGNDPDTPSQATAQVSTTRNVHGTIDMKCDA